MGSSKKHRMKCNPSISGSIEKSHLPKALAIENRISNLPSKDAKKDNDPYAQKILYIPLHPNTTKG